MSRLIASSTKTWIASLAAVGMGLAFASCGLGAENETSPAAGKAAATAAQNNQAQGTDQQNHRQSGDDVVRHQAALGVSVTRSDHGVTVVGIIPGSPAERAGLRLGDEISYVGDRQISSTQEFTHEIHESNPGARLELVVRRNGQRQIVAARLGAQEAVFGRQDNHNPPQPMQPGPRNGQSYRGAQQVNPPRAPNAYSYNPQSRTAGVSRQHLEGQIRELERQVYLLRQRIGQLRSAQNSSENEANDIEQWWEAGQRGENGDDPALFQ